MSVSAVRTVRGTLKWYKQGEPRVKNKITNPYDFLAHDDARLHVSLPT